jgi:hypothetical protein
MQGSGGDWHLEADKMDTIYSDAVVTIAAVDGTRLASACEKRPFLSRDVDPIPGRSASDSWRQHFTNISEAKDHVQILDGEKASPTPEAIWTALSRTGNFPSRPPGVLDERGWTFQERILSRRLVSITSQGVFWDCLHNSACDRRPTGLLGDFSPGFRDSDDRALKRFLFDSLMPANYRAPADLYWLWRRGVQDYTSRDLSEMGDRMIALNGIAKRMSARLADEYVLGIWKNDLLRSLIWFVEQHDTKLESLSDDASRFPLFGPRLPLYGPRVPASDESSLPEPASKASLPVVAPSWSWVSTTLPVKYRLWHPFERYIERKTEYVSNLAKVHHIYAARLDHYTFDVFHGSLTIGGSTIEAFLFDEAIFIRKLKAQSPISHTGNSPRTNPTSYASQSRQNPVDGAPNLAHWAQWSSWMPRSNSQMAPEVPPATDGQLAAVVQLATEAQPATQALAAIQLEPPVEARALAGDRLKPYDDRVFVESPFLADRLELLKQSRAEMLEVICVALLEGGYTNSLKARYYLVLQKSKAHAEEVKNGRRSQRHGGGPVPGPAYGGTLQHGPGSDYQNYQRVGICAFDGVQCAVIPQDWRTVNII